MKSIFKKLFLILKPHKKFIFIGMFLFTFFFLILFPYQDAARKISSKISTAGEINLQYDSIKVGFFPPKLLLQNAYFGAPFLNSPVFSKELVVKPSYLALLAFKPGAKLELNFEKSYLHFWLKKDRPSEKNSNPLQIRVSSKNFKLKHFEFLSSFFSSSKGSVDFFADLNLDLGYQAQPKGVFQFRAKNAEFLPYSFTRKLLGTIHLPRLKWKTLSGKAKISKGRLHLENLIVGEPLDAFYLQSKGLINILFQRFNSSVKKYDIEADLSLTEELKSHLFFLDIFLSNIGEKTSDNRVQYKVKITGQAAYPPKIKKLEK